MEQTRPSRNPAGPRLPSRVVAVALVFAFWLLVAWPLSPGDGRVLWADVAVGLVVAVLATLVMRETAGPRPGRLLDPRRWYAAIAYALVFAWHVVRGNLDVAWRVLHPAMPIRPGIVAATTTLRSAAARALLANSITLTPGTLTIDVVGDVLFIHCIHVADGDEDAFAAGIVGRFEGLIARMLE